MDTVAIVGVGLIGASFGLALRKAGFAGEIIGVSSARALAAGLACGAISSSASLAEAAARADLLYLAQPVDRILETITLLQPLARPGCVITDAASTKRQIVEHAGLYLPPESFLGGHPIAGKEQRGAEAADPDLFRNRPYVLTPATGELGRNPLSQELRLVLVSIGARVVEMSPEEHDSTLALTSHLPQLLSTALAVTLARSGNERVREVFGPGLVDMTRLALSSADLWTSIFLTNKTEVLKALDCFGQVLEELKNTFGKSDIAHIFEEAAEFSARIRNLPLRPEQP